MKLGGSWRMPTDAEWTELLDNCTWTWTTLNGVNGYKVTSNMKRNSIFLSAKGRQGGTCPYDDCIHGCYWSSSLFAPDDPYRAWYVRFFSNSISRCYTLRYDGLVVRPVTE